MNAPIADQIKAEAAKSLLERMAEKTKLVRFFRYNAAAKHGVPIDPNESFSISVPDTPVQEQQPVAQPAPVQPQSANVTINGAAEKDSSSWLKGILQTLAAVGALGAAVWGGSKLTTPEPTASVNNQTYQESPYQYLEDIGEHLP
jgi:hypothetical protein